MKTGTPQAAGPGNRDTLVDRMLDRFGISYICAHPEILFEYSYRPFMGEKTYHINPSRNSQKDEHSLYQKHGPEDRVYRMQEAYQILKELYAPCLPESHRPTTSQSRPYKNSSSRLYGRSPRPGRRY